jgi:hypothetical protein
MGYKYYEIKINDNPSLDEIFETILLICWHQDKQLSIVIPSNFSYFTTM